MLKSRAIKNALTMCVICILFGIMFVPTVNTNNINASSITKLKNTIQKSNNSNILYVGGTGPNNYTRIQDAINDANDGDTVFVYDDSSPYFENLIIDKSINLIGEDRNTTFIEAKQTEDVERIVVHITADEATITGFTVESNEEFYWHGIWATTNRSNIHGNNIFNTDCGILIVGNQNSICKNIMDNRGGYKGISIMQGENNTIIKNCIRNNDIGIKLVGSYTLILYNNISMNNLGMHVLRERGGIGGLNEIHHNNFISNKIHAIFSWCCGIRICDIVNVANWNNNYWRGWAYWIPKPIIGYIFITNYYWPQFILLNFDWHPATEPYEC